MLWLVVLGLGLSVFWQHRRIDGLSRQVAQLVESAEARRTAATVPSEHRPEPTPAPEPEPGLLRQPERIPDFAWSHLAGPEQSPTTPAEKQPGASPARPLPAPDIATQTPVELIRSATNWLTENGLAWLGGGALALGGVLLVAYAAERGFFTPAFRIAAAFALGLGALGLGEMLRRRPRGEGDNTALVSALVTAAGAATLYGAFWAAHSLYGFIPAAPAAVGLIAVSLGLLALAVLHGEALGLLAVAAAYAVPVVTDAGAWGGVVDSYAGLILATGLGVAAQRAWGRTGMLALAGASIWIVARLNAADVDGAGVLVCATPMLALSAAILSQRRGTSSGLVAWLPTVAVALTSLFAIVLWVLALGWTAAESHGPILSAFAMVAACGTAAITLRRGYPPRYLLVAPAGVVLLAAVAISGDGTIAPSLFLWFALMLAAVAGSGFAAGRGVRGLVSATISAASVAVALTLADRTLARTLPLGHAALEAAVGLVLALGAAGFARQTKAAESDLRVAAWVGASAETVALAIHAVTPVEWSPVAYAGLGLALAALAARLRWRGLAEAAAVAGLASFAALLNPQIARPALDGSGHLLTILGTGGGAALVQLGAWAMLRRARTGSNVAETASTLVVLTTLLGGFLALRVVTAPHGPSAGPIDTFMDASLRTLLLLASGLALSARRGSGRLGQWRGSVLVGVGLLHGLVLQGAMLHPWWGEGGVVGGPPMADDLLPGLLAPGLLLIWTARGLIRVSRLAARVSVGAGALFVALWLVSELRRLFHGADLSGGFSYAEIAAYGAAAIGFAVGLKALRSRLDIVVEGASDPIIDALTWGLLAVSGLLLCYFASPWWGPVEGRLRAPLLLALGYGLGVGLAVGTARRTSGPLAAAAWTVSAVELFAALTLAVRFAFHGGAMRVAQHELSLETWTFSAAWALYGLAVLVAGARTRIGAVTGVGLGVLLFTAAKVFLFDMAHLSGAIRAASFIALGAILLVGALAARRLATAGSPLT